jgi:hypothetical protein
MDLDSRCQMLRRTGRSAMHQCENGRSIVRGSHGASEGIPRYAGASSSKLAATVQTSDEVASHLGIDARLETTSNA